MIVKQNSEQGYKRILLVIVYGFCFLSGGTIRIVSYNILNFPEAMGMQRLDHLRAVVEYVQPDVLIVQEMQSQGGVNLFLDSIMNYQEDIYDAGTFHDGPGTDNAIFYIPDKVEVLYDQYLSTTNRDIAQYRLRSSESQQECCLFSLHFKASQGSANEAIRFEEAKVLREYLSQFAQGSYFLVLGDFNIYYSRESAYQHLVGDFSNNNGRLFDPLNASGYWHDNADFASIHTQSTRYEQLEDGGAAGGLDDRFDMVMCSQSFLDSAGLFISNHSYTIVGNDGNHFDISINQGYNSVVPANIADALYFASDHLPVFVDINDGDFHTTPEKIVKIWPNPMQNQAHIEFPRVDDFEKATLTLTNILGQRVYEDMTYNPDGFLLRRGLLPVGIYFVYVVVETRFNSYRYKSKMAIVQ